MTEVRATYSPDDNKIRIYPGDERIDSLLGDEYAAFKAVGYKWAAKQECFVCPRWTPDAEDWALDLAGWIGDEDYSAEERSADRAERFVGYRDRRAEEATGRADSFEDGGAVFGHQSERVASARARRAERLRSGAVSCWHKAEYWQSRTAGVISHAIHRSSEPVRRSRLLKLEAEWRKQRESLEKYAIRWHLWSSVVKLAASEGDDRLPIGESRPERWTDESPVLREALGVASCEWWGDYLHPRTGEKMGISRLLTHPTDPLSAGEAAAIWLAANRNPSEESSDSVRWLKHYEQRIAYERARLADEGGMAAEEDMIPGGWIRGGRQSSYTAADGAALKVSSDGFRQIQKVNKSNVTGRVVSVQVWGWSTGFTAESNYSKQETKRALVAINVERLPAGAYRAPTSEELTAFQEEVKAAKKQSKTVAVKSMPLLNLTVAEAQKIQDLWNATEKEKAMRHNRSLPEPQAILQMTQAKYSQLSKGSYSHCETVELLETLRTRDRNGSDLSQVVCKVRVAHGTGFYSTRRVIVLTDKPQKPLPWSEIERVKALQPTVDEVRATLPQVVRMMGSADERGSDEYRDLLAGAVHYGFAYSGSHTQSHMTEQGITEYRKVLAEQGQAVASEEACHA